MPEHARDPGYGPLKAYDGRIHLFKEKTAKGAQPSTRPEERSPQQNYPQQQQDYLPQQCQSYLEQQNRPEERPRQQHQCRIQPFHQSQYLNDYLNKIDDRSDQKFSHRGPVS